MSLSLLCSGCAGDAGGAVRTPGRLRRVPVRGHPSGQLPVHLAQGREGTAGHEQRGHTAADRSHARGPGDVPVCGEESGG